MKKNIVALLFTCVVLSLSACGIAESQESAETTAVVEEVKEQEEMPAPINSETEETTPEISETLETETEKEVQDTVETAETEMEEASENSEIAEITPEEIADVTHDYKWGIMEFEGEDSLVMEVKTNGSPLVAGSTIKFKIVYSIFDYKLFERITCGELVIDKNTYPDWANDGLTDGVFGFEGASFTLGTDEEEAEKGEPLKVIFSDTTRNGTPVEYLVTWNLDGTVEVNKGSFTEE
ncbi:MAG: hypothetical protein K5891_08355 [Lachnospiraceae bacterium]|nr:hypothetical protein [Lachnospiraceae bacterium]